MNNSKKGLWIVLLIIVVILIAWAIMAASNHNQPQNSNEAASSSQQSSAVGNTSGGTQSNNPSGGSSPSTNKKGPVITSLSPSSGRAGLSVTINGDNFTLYGNTVLFNGLSLGAVGSADTHHTSFVIPDSLLVCANNNCSNGKFMVNPGVYTVAIRNQNGTSNPVNYTVMAGGQTQ